MLDDIVLAITQNKIIEIEYAPGKRLIEPHVIGYSRTRNILLRAYQISGASNSPKSTGWKLFRIDRVAGIFVTLDNFVGSRAKYNPEDSAMKGGIITRL